jgi:hypothetical protein
MDMLEACLFDSIMDWTLFFFPTAVEVELIEILKPGAGRW